ncbi:MAG: glycosyltransferase family 39 protein [Candidatus Omnitrophica bacterium]|nr:glycosyltransferase family 39 protein [Candidatus Omnitrophota bacterium]
MARIHAALLTLIVIFFGLATADLIRDKSPNTDAVAFHLVNGYAYWKTHDFRMSPATPPLQRLWMTVPWLWMNPRLTLDDPAWKEADSVPFAMRFFYRDNRAMARSLLYASRAMVFLLSLALLAAVYRWCVRLYGAEAGILGVGLLAFSPVIVGYAAQCSIEMGISLFFFLAVYGIYVYAESGGKRCFPWSGAVAWGLALASKFTAVLLGPVFLGILVLRKGVLRGAALLVGVVIVSLFVVWGTYFFDTAPLLGPNVPRVEEKIKMIEAVADRLPFGGGDNTEFFKKAAIETPIPMPAWFLGLGGIFRSHAAPYRHYFMGEWRDHQVWFHYLFSFAVKTTVPLLIMIGWALAVFVFSPGRPRLIDGLYLLWPVGMLFFATARDTTGQGIRYLLPVYPFLAVFVSGLWSRLAASRKARILLVLLFGAHILIGVSGSRSGIAYFNELIGGPGNAYRYVRGSDLEWGQELWALGKYCQKNHIEEIRCVLFGSYDYTFYDIPAAEIDEDEYESPRRAVYAVSAFRLDQPRWTREFAPKEILNHTIWIYDFTGTNDDPT